MFSYISLWHESFSKNKVYGYLFAKYHGFCSIRSYFRKVGSVNDSLAAYIYIKGMKLNIRINLINTPYIFHKAFFQLLF